MRLLLIALLAAAATFSSNWPEFRGPTGQGIGADTPHPVELGPSRNVRWSAAVPGKGWSSPVVGGGRVWLTTASVKGDSLRALAFDQESGKQVVDVELFRPARPEAINSKNSYASPTPILDGDRVYVHFGSAGTAALDSSGKVLWKTRLPYETQHGAGGSPALHNGLLFINCDGTDRQYVAALDVSTGEIRWKRNRADGYQAYATPLVIEQEGRPVLISPGAHRTVAYDPATGQELWWVRYGQGFSNVPRPVYGNGLLFIATGFFEPFIYAVRPGGKGDVTDSHVAWKVNRGAPFTPSPILVEEDLYMVSDRGIASCLNAKSGELYWQERLEGNYSASPILAGGLLYFASEDGVVTVIEPSRTLKKIATNQMGEPIFASPAAVDGSLYLRTASRLYRFSSSASVSQSEPGKRLREP